MPCGLKLAEKTQTAIVRHFGLQILEHVVKYGNSSRAGERSRPAAIQRWRGICARSGASRPREALSGRREFVLQQRAVAVLLWIFFVLCKRKR